MHSYLNMYILNSICGLVTMFSFFAINSSCLESEDASYFFLSRLSDVFQPLCCQRKNWSRLSLVSTFYSVPGKVKMQHLRWTALKFSILTPSLKGVGKLGRNSAAASSFSSRLFKNRDAKVIFLNVWLIPSLFLCHAYLTKIQPHANTTVPMCAFTRKLESRSIVQSQFAIYIK